MELIEKTLKKEVIYKGSILELSKEEVLLPDGTTADREIITHSGGVGIVPITEDNKIVLIKQFRNAAKTITLEIPAGKFENAEKPEVCAARELKEETGYTAGELISAVNMFASPAYTSEFDYLYVAKDLKKGIASPDSDEFIQCVEYDIDELKEMVFNKKITDAKTIIGILIADRYKY